MTDHTPEATASQTALAGTDTTSTDTTSTDTTSTDTRDLAPSVNDAPATRVRRRKPALDQKLAQAKDFALDALKELVAAQEIGDGHRVAADDERLVTHYFTSTKRGYRDWEWYVTIARAPRQAVPTVCETGILPSDTALLAPEWVPWSERLSDAERDAQEADAGDHADSAESTDKAEPESEDEPTRRTGPSSASEAPGPDEAPGGADKQRSQPNSLTED